MTTLSFEREINAPASVVWNALWQDDNYRTWTSTFCEGSYAMTDGWAKESKVQFLSPGGDGMYSKIVENIPEEKMSFIHLGEVKNFQEQPSDTNNEWHGAREEYELSHQMGVTTLKVYVDVAEKHKESFEQSFEKGLDILKAIAEKKMAVAK